MRPTYLKHKDLYEYDGCASFVADYFTYKTLQICSELVCNYYWGLVVVVVVVGTVTRLKLRLACFIIYIGAPLCMYVQYYCVEAPSIYDTF